MIVVTINRSLIIHDRQGKITITDGSDHQITMHSTHLRGMIVSKIEINEAFTAVWVISTTVYKLANTSLCKAP